MDPAGGGISSDRQPTVAAAFPSFGVRNGVTSFGVGVRNGSVPDLLISRGRRGRRRWSKLPQSSSDSIDLIAQGEVDLQALLEPRERSAEGRVVSMKSGCQAPN